MKKLTFPTDQLGLAPILAIVVLLLVAAAGFASWRVWNDGNKSGSENTSLAETVEPEEPEPVFAMPPNKSFRVELPEGWVQSTCETNKDLVFVAPTEDNLGVCDGEEAGTMVLSRVKGDIRKPEIHYTSNPDFSIVSYVDFTAGGIKGYRVNYTFNPEGDDLPEYPPAGTLHTHYILFDGAYSYNMTYTREPSEVGVVEDIRAIADSFQKL